MCSEQQLQYGPFMSLLFQCDTYCFDHPGSEVDEGLLPWTTQLPVCCGQATF